MKTTIDCPRCGEEKEIDSDQEVFQCANCKIKFEISFDFEFVDGQWRNASKLREILF